MAKTRPTIASRSFYRVVRRQMLPAPDHDRLLALVPDDDRRGGAVVNLRPESRSCGRPSKCKWPVILSNAASQDSPCIKAITRSFSVKTGELPMSVKSQRGELATFEVSEDSLVVS